MTMRFCWFMLLYVYVCWLWHSFQYVVIRTQLILMTSVDVVIYSCRSCASNLYVQLSAICISASYNDLIRCHQTISNLVVREFLPTHVLISVIWSLVKWDFIPFQMFKCHKRSSHKKIRRELVPGLISFWFPFWFFTQIDLKKAPPKKKHQHFCLPRLPSGSFDLALEKFTSFGIKLNTKVLDVFEIIAENCHRFVHRFLRQRIRDDWEHFLWIFPMKRCDVMWCDVMWWLRSHTSTTIAHDAYLGKICTLQLQGWLSVWYHLRSKMTMILSTSQFA